MQCEILMKRNVVFVTPQDTVDEAARRMRDRNIGFLPVCDADRKVVGALTDRDVAIRFVAEEKPWDTRVGDVMTREVVACHPTDDATVVEQLMRERHKSRIICVDAGGHLVGVISLSDLVQSENEERAAQTLREVTRRGPSTHH